MIYLAGSLRNADLPGVGNTLRKAGLVVFDDWFAAGKIADDSWQLYETERGHDFASALVGIAAEHTFTHDKDWLDFCTRCVLVLPAGKSAHLELGYMIGQGKPGYVLMDVEPERFDLMYKLATAVCFSVEGLIERLVRGE